jgi:DNA-binding transcriptional LysR family regulator
MNWDDLRIFLALARSGSVSGAGKALGVTHTTVARRVVALEADLGTRLFDRSRDGYALTQIGENMVPLATEIEERAQTIGREVFGRDAALEGVLRLTAPYDFSNRVLVPALPSFRQRYPAIELELLTTTGHLDLAAREADLAVRLTPSPPDYLVGQEVVPLRHGVYAKPAYWKRHGTNAAVILFRGEQSIPEWVDEYFPGADIALRTDNLSTMLAAVEAGLGIARMPCFEADARRGIRRLDVQLTPSKWGVWILNHADLRSTARVRVAREYFRQVIAAAAPRILGETSRYL